jgi:hypothetical protein
MFPLLLAAALPGADAPLFSARELTAGDAVVRTTCGTPAKDYILEVDGGGLIVEDFNADGHLDLVVVDGSTLARAQAGEAGFPARLLLGDGRGGFTQAGEAWEAAPET